MKQLIAWTEIPASDIERAKRFYAGVLGVDFAEMRLGDLDYAIIVDEGRGDTAALVRGEGYEPSSAGVTIYLNGAPDMDPFLARVAANGGEVLMPKTYFSPEAGYVGYFRDSEGNRIGLQHA